MKVGLRYGLAGYRGKLDGLVYYYDKSLGCVQARRLVYPRPSAENERLGSIADNLFAIQPSEAFKDDLRLYLPRYKALRKNRNSSLRSWVNVYMLMMYNLAKLMPKVDLRTINRKQIYADNLPCISIKSAVEAGLLPEVCGYANLDRQI